MPVAIIATTTAIPVSEAALYRSMTWLSPSYPIGAFSYSHGLEYAVEAELVRDETSLKDFVATVLDHDAGRIDAAIVAAAWEAAENDDAGRLDDLADLATAWRGSSEMGLESTAQGAAFLRTTRAAWPSALLDALATKRERKPLPLSVAVGAAAAVHDVPLIPVLTAYLHSVAANLVSAGIRLVPLGQTEGQRILAAIEGLVGTIAAEAAVTPLDEIGSSAALVDWCSIRHETQYTRLFRS